jgi:anthranilate synthase component 1
LTWAGRTRPAFDICGVQTTLSSTVPRYFPAFEEYSRIAKSAQIVPVYRQLLADRLTPVTAFEILGRDEHAFLLESVVGGEKIGRYSFIASGPKLAYQAYEGKATIQQVGAEEKQFKTSDPLGDLQKLLPKKTYHKDKRLPAFTGGLVGYAGYDTIRYYEGEKLPRPPADDRRLPDLLFALYGEMVIFDHLDKTIKVVGNADLSNGDSAEIAYKKACLRIDEIVTRLKQPPLLKLGEIDTSGDVTLPFTSNFTQEEFEQVVVSGKEFIKAGDIFQFVPSQRLRVSSPADPLDVYRALRIINPSPYMFFLKSPACTLIGSSPEILCKVEHGTITSRPLAGTRRRGASEAEDVQLEKELLADPKERAEHIMLVDLHRNDVGRVSKIGSVRVSDTMTVERYSHVMHITSNVTGQLDEQYSAMDALRVSLPVGTVSGAPKIRAMQIIDELEKSRRGPYGGAVGYLDFSGDLDTCIALRTIVWKNGTYDVQAGAGVVADSVPASEYKETMDKAKAMLKAVEIAEKQFGAA